MFVLAWCTLLETYMALRLYSEIMVWLVVGLLPEIIKRQ